MRLTIKEIGTVNTKVLNTRFCQLMLKSETLPANEISVAEAREVIRIEDELHQRMIRAVGHDFYPPDRIEKQAPSNYMISLLKSRQEPTPRATEISNPCSAAVIKKAETEMKTEGQFRFKIIITSSIGSVVAQKNVKMNSRSDADLAAQNLIKLLGLKRATYKIT